MDRVSEKYSEAAAIFRLLSHPVRLCILDELRSGEACVCHLQTILGRPQAYVSQQLRVLRDADVVTVEKDGLNVYYRIADGVIRDLLEIVLGPAGPERLVRNCPCPRCASGNCSTGELSIE